MSARPEGGGLRWQGGRGGCAPSSGSGHHAVEAPGQLPPRLLDLHLRLEPSITQRRGARSAGGRPRPPLRRAQVPRAGADEASWSWERRDGGAGGAVRGVGGVAGPEKETRVRLEDLGGEDDEVDKVMRWAMDVSRLDVATAGVVGSGDKAKRAEEEEEKDEKSSVSSEDDEIGSGDCEEEEGGYEQVQELVVLLIPHSPNSRRARTSNQRINSFVLNIWRINSSLLNLLHKSLTIKVPSA